MTQYFSFTELIIKTLLKNFIMTKHQPQIFSLNHINCMLYHFLGSSKLERFYCPSVLYTSGVCSTYNYKNNTFITLLECLSDDDAT